MTDPDAYVVTAPYVTPKVRDLNSGGFVIRGHYEGAVIQAENIDATSLAHHLDSGLMAAVETPVVAEPAKAEPAKLEPAKAKAK